MQENCKIFRILFAVTVLVSLTVGISTAATVIQDITYQGLLTDSGGNPLTGTYGITFNLYDVDYGGSPLATSVQHVLCTNGQFTTPVTFDPSLFDGRALWLGITVDADPEMTPRQEIRPVPYAMSLRPGAVISDSTSGWLIMAQNTGTGPALIGQSWDGEGVFGRGKSGGAFTTNGEGTETDTRIGVNVSTEYAYNPGIIVSTSGQFSNGVRVSTSGYGSNALYSATAGETSYGTVATTSGRYSDAIRASTSADDSTGVYIRTYGSRSPGISATTSNPHSDGIFTSTSGIDSDGIDTSTSNDGSHGVRATTYGTRSQGIYTSTYGSESNGIESRTAGEYSGGVFVETSGYSSPGVFVSTSNITSRGVSVLTTGYQSHGVASETFGSASVGLLAGTYSNNSEGVVAYTNGKDSNGVVVTTIGNNSNGVVISTFGIGSHGMDIQTAGTESWGLNVTSHQGLGINVNTHSTNMWYPAISARNNGQGMGIHALSHNFDGIYAETERSDMKWGVYSPDYIGSEAGVQTAPHDLAEYMPVSEEVTPGTVLVIAEGGVFEPCTAEYDTHVAGIVSTAAGFTLGMNESGNTGEVQVALAGRVPCKVDASKGAIRGGDLLTTSSLPGYAMKAEPVDVGGLEIYRPGTVLGKAMGTLESGTGTIEVLVTLQ